MRKLLYILTAGVFLFACKKEKNEQKAQIFPLKEGNKWTYSVKEYKEDGSVLAAYNVTRVVKGTKTINSQTYFVVLDSADNTDTLGLFRSDDTKVYTYAEDFSKEVTAFKWPASEGEIIHSENLVFAKVEVIASAGSFQINGYDSRKATVKSYLFGELINYAELFAKPAIGLTGNITYDLKSSEDGFYKSEEEVLTSYTLK